MTATIPTYLWPSQAHLVPTVCPRPECRSRLIERNLPMAGQRTGDVVCVVCSWAACNLREDGFAVPASLTTRRDTSLYAPLCTLCGDRPPVAGRRICSACRNQQDRDREQAKRLAAKRLAAKRPPEDEHRAAARRSDAAYRERVKAGQTRQRWATGYDACVECGLATRKHHGYGICYGCRDRSNERKHYRGALAEVAS